MIELLIVFAGMMSVMYFWPETASARFLHKHLVERPVQCLATKTHLDALYYIVLIAVILSAGEAVAVLGSTDMLLLYAWDITLYIDAVAAVTMVAVSTPLQSIMSRFQSGYFRSSKTGAAPRQKKSRKLARPMKPSNDDHPGDYWRVAA
jgi:hypothetical protein